MNNTRLLATVFAALALGGATVAYIAHRAAQPPLTAGGVATELLDGRYLLSGGTGDGRASRTLAVWDPATRALEPVTARLRQPRQGHRTLRLRDGRVVIAGGVSEAAPEVFDPRTNRSSLGRTVLPVSSQTNLVRLERGGRDTVIVYEPGGSTVRRFDPDSLETVTVPAKLTAGPTGDVLETDSSLILTEPGNIPRAFEYALERQFEIDIGTVHVDETMPPDALLVARFAADLDPASVTASSVQLLGAGGAVASRVYVAGGRVLIRPERALTPGARYGFYVKGVRAQSGADMPIYNADFGASALRAARPLPAPRKGFVVKPLGKGHIGGYTASRLGFIWEKNKSWQKGAWVPTSGNMYGQWATNFLKEEGRPLLPSAPAGVTAVAGEVRRVDGVPLEGIRLTIGERSVLSDARGQFVLRTGLEGRQVLEVDGDAHRDGPFGTYVIGVNLERGRTVNLPQTVWLNPIDTGAMVDLPSPTTQETIITHAAMPGFELRIPKGTVIRGRDGRIVTRVGLTPLPIDRPPFAMPEGSPVYFTIQPGGARIETTVGERSLGARLIYPNYNGLEPGTKTAFYNYDPGSRDWFEYGLGTVSADGRQSVPDAGVSIFEFAGAMNPPRGTGPGAPGIGPPPGADGSEDPGPPGGPPDGGPPPKEGDPVDMSTGLFIHHKTDLSIGGIIPITVSRTYRQSDPTARAFGRGWSMAYNMYMLGVTNSYQNVDLVLHDGSVVPYVRTSPGTGYADAVFTHTGTPSAYANTTIRFTGGGWVLAMRDGSTIYFPSFSPATRFCGRDGQCLEIARQGTAIRKITAPGNRFVAFTLDGANRITEAKDHSGRVVKYTYDTEGLLWKATYPDNTVEEYTYNALGDLETIKNRRGIVILRNQYDANGRVTRQTDATGGVYQYGYTVYIPPPINFSNVAAPPIVTASTYTDPRGSTNDRAYDGGYITSMTVSSNSGTPRSTSSTRSSSSRVVMSNTMPSDRRVEYVRDANGNVMETKLFGPGNVLLTSSKVDRGAFELVTKTTNALGKETRFEYDDRGRLVRTVDPMNRTSSVTYDALSRPLTSTDARGKVTRMTYSGVDLSRVTDPLGRSVNTVTDILGRTVRVTNPLGNSVSMEYDVMDRVTKMTDSKGNTVLYEYDAVGNMTKLTEARGKFFTFEYDGRNRLVKRTDPRGKFETFEYDPNDNVIASTDKKGQITRVTYDLLGRIDRIRYPDDTRTIYAYDARDRVSSISEGIWGNAAHTNVISMEYDALDRVTKETVLDNTVNPAQSRIIQYEYDALGRRTKMTAGTQTPVTYTYNDSDQLLTLTQGSSVTTFTYNASSGLLEKMTHPNGVSQNYNFDDAGQFTSITYRNSNNAVIGDLQYTYDAAGRRTKVNGSFARMNLPSAVTNAVYDDFNRLTSWNGQGITYDDNGNMLSDGSRTYTWDSRDRLVAIAGSSTASFKYDALGRRLTKTINGTTTSYQYDGDNVVSEFDGTHAQTASFSSVGVDGWLSRTEGANSRQFLTDALGSVIATADSSGALRTQYSYEPYGRTTSTGEASNNPFQYTGRENDGTGLYYYRARYYNPVFQRFISSDPIGLSGGLNTYEYAAGNPLTLTDPSGNSPIKACAVIAGYSGFVLNMTIQNTQLFINLVTNGAHHGEKTTFNWSEALISGGGAALGCTGIALGGVGITNGIAQAALGNAFGNAAASAAGQWIENKCISGTQVLREGAFGFATGAMGGGVQAGVNYFAKVTQPHYVFDMRFYDDGPIAAIVKSNGAKIRRWLQAGRIWADLAGGVVGATPYLFPRSDCRSQRAQK